jgi:predicted hydrocarbon binding protein
MVYTIGRYNGSYEAEDLLEEVKTSDKKFTRMELLETAFESMAKMGWAKIDVEEYDMVSGEGTLSSPYHLFSSSCETPNSAGCFFLRGFLSALISKIMEIDTNTEAISCDGKGEGRCLFKISRR